MLVMATQIGRHRMPKRWRLMADYKSTELEIRKYIGVYRYESAV
jgi:hypothetical protein